MMIMKAVRVNQNIKLVGHTTKIMDFKVLKCSIEPRESIEFCNNFLWVLTLQAFTLHMFIAFVVNIKILTTAAVSFCLFCVSKCL